MMNVTNLARQEKAEARKLSTLIQREGVSTKRERLSPKAVLCWRRNPRSDRHLFGRLHILLVLVEVAGQRSFGVITWLASGSYRRAWGTDSPGQERAHVKREAVV